METALRVCTIIARNYWAHARVLTDSVLRHHPDARVVVLVIDCTEATSAAAARERFDVVCVDDIGLDRDEFLRMAGIYNVLELSTALKPWLLRHLLAQDSTPVVYLDPDMEVFGDIGIASEHASTHGIVLTPHSIEPMALDLPGPNDLTILQSGIYNLGFIAVGERSTDFLDWWSARLRRDCLISKEEGIFVDQRWVDLVPSYFADPYVIRDPGWNVAYWNLTARHLSRTDDGYRVNDQPMRLFHYSGFDPDRPGHLSQYLGEEPSRLLLTDEVLVELCAHYADRLILAGHRARMRVPYLYDRAASGLRLDHRARRLYRTELMAFERGEAPEPPNPFTGEVTAFVDWLNAPGGRDGVTRYHRELYEEREDVRTAFPYVDGVDARRFVDWVRTEGAAHHHIADELFRAADEIDDRPGVDISGYMAAENGVGEAARRYIDVFAAAGIPHTVLTYRNTKSRQTLAANAHVEAAYDLNLVIVNADQFPTFVNDAPREWTEGYTIGQWAWEVERLPDWMAASSIHLDEIWVCSEHAARAIRPRVDKHVVVLPPPIVPPRVRPMSRAELGLPDGFIFLFCFDFDSVFERKNPLAVIEAFRRAFPTPDGPMSRGVIGTAGGPGGAAPPGPKLVVKSVRGDAHREQLDALRAAARGRPDIQVVDGYLAAEEQAALMSLCDAYVSLHRAEGFGFTLAEAMALGKPVVATAYSGNLEFMDETNSWLVPYHLVPVPEGCDPYPTDARWAEPDLDAAADAMREVFSDAALAQERGHRAADDIARLHSPDARIPLVLRRLEDIGSLRRRGEMKVSDPTLRSVVHGAERHLTAGIDVASPTRYGRISRLWRRFVQRLLRHYTEQQERVQRSLVDSVRELEERLASESSSVRELELKLEKLEAERTAEALEGDIQELRPRHSEDEGGVVRPFRERRL